VNPLAGLNPDAAAKLAGDKEDVREPSFRDPGTSAAILVGVLIHPRVRLPPI
jgi:hypothetical protein